VTPLERLLLEAIPTRPTPAPAAPRQTEIGRYWTAAEQDAHWAELATALGVANERRPHLRVATQPAA
jgi:hypothetical protein